MPNACNHTGPFPELSDCKPGVSGWWSVPPAPPGASRSPGLRGAQTEAASWSPGREAAVDRRMAVRALGRQAEEGRPPLMLTHAEPCWRPSRLAATALNQSAILAD